MPSQSPCAIAFATAIAGLRRLFLAPGIEVVARHPDGTVELRFNSREGSYLAATILVPPLTAAAPRLRVVDIRAWHAPAKMLLHPVEPGEMNMKRCFLLLLIVDLCRDALMDALGPGARHAAWWTDRPPIGPSRRRSSHGPGRVHVTDSRLD